MIDELLSQDEINALLSGGGFGGGAGNDGSSGDMTAEQQHVLNDIANLFSSSAASVFGMLAGKEVSADIQKMETVSQEELVSATEAEPFAFRVLAGGLNNAPITMLVTKKGALTLADLMMGGEGKDLPDEASELYLNAAQEGLSQVVGAAFTSMSSLLGGKRLMPENVSSALETEEWLPFPSLAAAESLWRVSASLEMEGLGSFPLEILFPLEVAKKIADEVHAVVAGKKEKEQPAPSAQSQQQPKQAPQQQPQAIPQQQQSFGGGGEPAPSFGNVYDQSSVDVRPAEFVPLTQKSVSGFGSKIDLVADIPVRVTVELGRTRKNIADILNMTPGSVIELDKMAGEPVDVLVNSKLIAKGEVVVIDENFGVRITEIVTSAGRVHSL
ncbi:MAG: flagellar motor switch phosphatase FliY [Synergistaceae bacterium]|nr:flagellar motor switch phosphatase FliY [Synergistaceae bacterium]